MLTIAATSSANAVPPSSARVYEAFPESLIGALQSSQPPGPHNPAPEPTTALTAGNGANTTGRGTEVHPQAGAARSG